MYDVIERDTGTIWSASAISVKLGSLLREISLVYRRICQHEDIRHVILWEP